MQEQVYEYFNNYFDGTLNESTTNAEIMDAVYDLIDLTEDVLESVGLDEDTPLHTRTQLLTRKKRLSKLGSEILKPENYGEIPMQGATDAEVSKWNRAQDRMKRASSSHKEKRARLSTAMDKFNSKHGYQ
jgi:hypothetical protein